MVGAGAVVFAVMGYTISKQQPPDFNVELNAKLLSAILGEPEQDVQSAIEYLCAPDPGSRTDKHDGKRLIKVGAFTYHVVNGEMYHSIRSYEERKAYNRAAQAKYREKKKVEGVELPDPVEPKKRFQKPTIEQCLLAAEKIGLSDSECHKFFNFYESKGWKVGKNQMASWSHAMAGWKSRSAEYSGNPPQDNHAGRKYTPEELVRMSQL